MSARMLALGAALAVLLGATVSEASLKLTARASATPRGLVVGGNRLFPVMLLDQCDETDAAQGRALGINLVMNEHCTGITPARQLAMLRGHALAVLSIRAGATRGSSLVGWTYPDEPDNNGWTPGSLARAHPYARGNHDGLVTFLTTSGRFFRPAPPGAGAPRSHYAGFARLADMAGFDLYPLNACQSDLTSVYAAQRLFVRLAGSTPTFQWIETGPIKPTYCGGFTMTPDELAAEVWLAVIGGARGIGYFTHTWSPVHRAFDVAPALQAAMKRTNALLAAVRPGLLGATVPAGVDSPVVKLLARSARGRTYVFAVNPSRMDTKAQIHVAQLADGPVTVVGEQRTLVATGGNLVDHFGPLQAHVYVQSP